MLALLALPCSESVGSVDSVAGPLLVRVFECGWLLLALELVMDIESGAFEPAFAFGLQLGLDAFDSAAWWLGVALLLFNDVGEQLLSGPVRVTSPLLTRGTSSLTSSAPTVAASSGGDASFLATAAAAAAAAAAGAAAAAAAAVAAAPVAAAAQQVSVAAAAQQVPVAAAAQ